MFFVSSFGLAFPLLLWYPYPIHGCRTFIHTFFFFLWWNNFRIFVEQKRSHSSHRAHEHIFRLEYSWLDWSAIEWGWLDVLKNPRQQNGIEIDYLQMEDAMTQIRRYVDWNDSKEREWRRLTSMENTENKMCSDVNDIVKIKVFKMMENIQLHWWFGLWTKCISSVWLNDPMTFIQLPNGLGYLDMSNIEHLKFPEFVSML